MNALRAWRKDRKRTLEELSGLLGVSMGSLSRIERGEQWPDRAIMVRIAEVTEGAVTANDFLSAPASQETGDAA